MITLDHIVAGTADITDTLTLPFELRQKSRQRVVLGSGREAALMIERGVVLRGNDRLAGADETVLVIAAREQVSTVESTDLLLLTRAAYHLGNRHVPLQVGHGFVRYQVDHVLDAMVRDLGLSPRVEQAPFEPEAGAYGRHTHSHGHVLLRAIGHAP